MFDSLLILIPENSVLSMLLLVDDEAVWDDSLKIKNEYQRNIIKSFLKVPIKDSISI
jgi:hypothetical protein